MKKPNPTQTQIEAVSILLNGWHLINAYQTGGAAALVREISKIRAANNGEFKAYSAAAFSTAFDIIECQEGF